LKALSANFYDLKLIKGHDTVYIEEFYPHFDINTSLTLLVRSDFLRPIRFIGYFEEGALVWRGDFWQFMVFFLKEGLQLGFACYFLGDL
jgi:hypothetical protein